MLQALFWILENQVVVFDELLYLFVALAAEVTHLLKIFKAMEYRHKVFYRVGILGFKAVGNSHAKTAINKLLANSFGGRIMVVSIVSSSLLCFSS